MATPSPRSSNLRALSLATVFAAGSGYLVMWLATKELGAAGYSLFAAFWAAFFALGGVANGLLQEGTRAIRSARSETGIDDGPPASDRILPTGLLLGALMAAVVLVSWPAWDFLGMPTLSGIGPVVLAFGIAGFAAQAACAAALSGTERWNGYAALLTVDAALRLLVGVLAWAFGAGIGGFVAATVAGATTWLLLLACYPGLRSALASRLDVGRRRLWANTSTAMSASAGTAVLIVGFPLLVTATARPDDSPALLGAVILAITLTRAPLLVPLTSFQSALIVHFVRRRAEGARALLLPLGATAAIGVVGAALAWAIGPWLLETIFDADFVIPGVELAGLTFASVGTAALMITGNAAVAREKHALYLWGWWIAAGTSVVALVAGPGAIDDRATIALLVGPGVGVAAHLLGLIRPDTAAADGRAGAAA